MGYSQEIRDIPQKILDDTGLKEALDEVQHTTREVTTELNTTVNEAIQEARVPEAENLQIGAVPFSIESDLVKKERALALPKEAENVKEQAIIETAGPAVESEAPKPDIALAIQEPELSTTPDASLDQTDDSLSLSKPNETITIEAQSLASSTEVDEVKTGSQKKPRRRTVKNTLVEEPAEENSQDIKEQQVVKPTRKIGRTRKKDSAKAELVELTQVLASDTPVETAQTATTTEDNSGQPEQRTPTDSTQPESTETVVEEQPKPKRRQKRISLPESAEPLEDKKPLEKVGRPRKKAVAVDSGLSSRNQELLPESAVEIPPAELSVEENIIKSNESSSLATAERIAGNGQKADEQPEPKRRQRKSSAVKPTEGLDPVKNSTD